MIEVANRLHTVEEYYFSKKLREVNIMKAAGAPIINLGIGSPDLQPPTKVVSAIVEGLQDEAAHKYQSYQGLPELREAMASFYRDQFQVHLSPMTEILPLIKLRNGHLTMAEIKNKIKEDYPPEAGHPDLDVYSHYLDVWNQIYNEK